MNITILSLIFPPETGSARRVGELAEYYSSKGHNVSVVTGFPTYPKGSLYPGYRKKLIAKEQPSDLLTIIRVWLFTTIHRASTVKRLFHYGSFTVTSLLGAIFGKRPDVIYVVSHPYFLVLTAKVVRFLRGGKIVLDVQDSWPEAPIALGYIRWQWLIRLLEWSEKIVYRSSDLILTLSPEMLDHLIERGAEKDKTKVIYNWVDHGKYAAKDENKLRTSLGLDGAFVLLYAGNIGKPQGLEIMIEAAELTRDYQDICYVIVGDGAEKPALEESATSKGLGNIRLLPSVSETEIVEYLSMADALLVHLKRAPHRRGVIPSKLQVYMAVGRPILLGAVGAPARIVKEASCGINFEPDDPLSMTRAVLSLYYASEKQRESMGYAGRAFAVRNFDLERQCGLSEKLMVAAATVR